VRRLNYSDDALEDIASIVELIATAAASQSAGDRFADRLTRRCEQLASLPGTMGRPRPELRDDLRSIAFGNYVVFFRYLGGTLEIVNVLEGHRDLDAHFHPDA